MVGVLAGLIPCPLTLFAMMFAIGRGVPEAGLVFAGSFMIGVAATLSLVALIAISARGGIAALVQQSGGNAELVRR
jgi:ABC-type nickel/cobalt efflux system permease component RcnA